MVGVTVAQGVLEDHDIAVVNVTPSSTLVKKGDLTDITVVVENQGNFTETFNLNCTYKESLIDTPVNITLASGESRNVTFSWNTTGSWDHSSPQKITASASTVPGETDTEDNTLVSPIRVRVFESPYVAVVPHSTVNTNLTIGTTYKVSIITDYNGSDITGWQLTIGYNPNILHGVEVTNGDLITNATHPGDALYLPGTFNDTTGTLSQTAALFFTAGNVISGPGTLANVTFTVVGLGESPISLVSTTQLKGWNSTEVKTYNIVSNYPFFRLLHGSFKNADVTNDVAVISVTAFPTEVVKGESVNITVIITNKGTVAIDVTVKIFYSYEPGLSTPIETRTVRALAVGTNQTLTFVWDTKNILVKTHPITAIASELHGEIATNDNKRDSDTPVTIKERIEPPIPIELVIGFGVAVLAVIVVVLLVLRRAKRPAPQ